MAALLVAGLGKAMDVAQFDEQLSTWRIFPQWAIAPVALMIPAAEVGTFAAWITTPQGKIAKAAAGLLILSTSVVYGTEWAIAEAPQCACFGILSRFDAFEARAATVEIRNAVFLFMLALGTLLARRAETDQRGGNSNERPSEDRACLQRS